MHIYMHTTPHHSRHTILFIEMDKLGDKFEEFCCRNACYIVPYMCAYVCACAYVCYIVPYVCAYVCACAYVRACVCAYVCACAYVCYIVHTCVHMCICVLFKHV